MRVIATINRPECNITFLHWNNKFLIKLEAGPFEQTFKVDEYELSGDEDLNKIVSEEFIAQAMQRFDEMSRSLHQSVEKL